MQRLRGPDRWLLAVFVPLWLVCFGLHLKQLSRGELAWVPVTVRAGTPAQPHPSVSGLWPDARAETSRLRVGDRLLRIGQRDLAGAGALDFLVGAYEAADAEGGVRVEAVRDGERLESRFQLLPVRVRWRLPLLSLGFALPAILALLQRPGSRAVRAFFLGSLCYSLHWTFFFGGSAPETRLWAGVFVVSAFLFFPLALRAIRSFPEPPAHRSRFAAAWIWIFSAYGLAATSWVFGVPFLPAQGVRAAAVLNVVTPLTMIVLLTRSFARADALGRRQLKWVLYGFYVSALPVAAASLLPAASPQLWWVHELMMSAMVLLPICVLIAIAHANLFDIDRLISATASYNVLLVLLVGGALLVVPRVAEASSDLLGMDRSLGQVAVSLLLAALAVRANRHLRPRIERLFFAERHALEQGITRLLDQLANCAEPRQLLQLVGERLDALLRPEGCTLYARDGAAFSPVFARGHGLPPALPATSPLLEALADSPRAISTERLASATHGLGPFDRAALDALGAPLLVCIQRGSALAGFLCLGPKRSGDVYTPVDRALLGALADRVSSELERFDQAETVRQARAMQEALRRYVPGAVAEQLAGGASTEQGEREVSVLFVDIRGYSSYAEQLRADEIFSFVNRYTETVSALVRKHGGNIVEFNGDGMMAVFGAPQPLARKEAAAVEAGRSIVAGVSSLATDGSRPVAVGVGIATGASFVGSVRAVDRMIWTCLGNTTNLAARLQALTRDVHAAIVIDAATFGLAGAVAADFRKLEARRVRGRSEPLDLFALPLAGPA